MGLIDNVTKEIKTVEEARIWAFNINILKGRNITPEQIMAATEGIPLQIKQSALSSCALLGLSTIEELYDYCEKESDRISKKYQQNNSNPTSKKRRAKVTVKYTSKKIESF